MPHSIPQYYTIRDFPWKPSIRIVASHSVYKWVRIWELRIWGTKDMWPSSEGETKTKLTRETKTHLLFGSWGNLIFRENPSHQALKDLRKVPQLSDTSQRSSLLELPFITFRRGLDPITTQQVRWSMADRCCTPSLLAIAIDIAHLISNCYSFPDRR